VRDVSLSLGLRITVQMGRAALLERADWEIGRDMDGLPSCMYM